KGWCNKETGEDIRVHSKTVVLNETGFSGIHIVDPEIFNYMKDGVYSLTRLYLDLAADHKIFTFRHDDGFWADIGTLSNLETVRQYFRKSGDS
ncbi:MAG: nucleotidyl transferase, partial [Odoribacter sp.]|nr:nucleotidyl transferase [Odoribacter sp.]